MHGADDDEDEQDAPGWLQDLYSSTGSDVHLVYVWAAFCRYISVILSKLSKQSVFVLLPWSGWMHWMNKGE